jgi:hypothetical protein
MYQDYLRRDGFIAGCAFIILDILYNCKRFELCKMYKSQVLSASYAATIRRVYGHAITSGQEIIANSLSSRLSFLNMPDFWSCLPAQPLTLTTHPHYARLVLDRPLASVLLSAATYRLMHQHAI